MGSHQLRTGVDQFGVLEGRRRRRTDPQHAVLAVHHDVDALRQVVHNASGQPNAEVRVVAVSQLACRSSGDLLAGPPHLHGTSPLASTTRWTKMPGRCTESGSSEPTSTTCSASTTVMRPAIATSGLKLRADAWKTALP